MYVYMSRVARVCVCVFECLWGAQFVGRGLRECGDTATGGETSWRVASGAESKTCVWSACGCVLAECLCVLSGLE